MRDTAVSRKADLLDAMMLVAAFVVGLAISRTALFGLSFLVPNLTSEALADWSNWKFAVADKAGTQYWIIQTFVDLLCGFALPLTPAILIARLRGPRPQLRQVVFQPGFVACAAFCTVCLICVDLAFFDIVSITRRIGIISIGVTVLGLWLMLLVTGRWLADRSWIDRAGGLVGVFWIVTAGWMIWTAI